MMKTMIQRAIKKDFIPMMLLGILMLCITWGARFIGVNGLDGDSFLPEHAAAKTPAPAGAAAPEHPILIVAHRGVRMKAPENTMPAIQLAMDMGYNYVEIDVRYTRDHVPMLLHDETVDRTTNGHGPLADLTLDQALQLDAGSWFDSKKFAGTRIPTLEQALTAMQGKISLYLDMKEEPDAATVALLRQYGFFPADTVINGQTAAFRALAPDAPIMPGLSSAADVAGIIRQFPGPSAFNTNCMTLTKDMVDTAHAAGVRIFCNTLESVWPSEEKKAMKNALALGADALQTDRPDILFPLLSRLQTKSNVADSK